MLESSRAEIALAHELLTEQAEELRRSNRDLEQFAYVASHDLQEPLRKIASFTQLLQKRYGGQMDERADQYIAFAVDGAKRMQQLIQDLLGFSRVGRVGGEVSDVDLAVALDDALENLSESVAESGAVVTHDELPIVRGEHPLLVQLLQNLVGNAIKFRDPSRPPTVHLSATRMADSWELECRDNGIGIDPQYAERVFVIFQRLHAKDIYEAPASGSRCARRSSSSTAVASGSSSPTARGPASTGPSPRPTTEPLNGDTPVPNSTKIIDVLLVEDDPGDVLMTREAFEDNKLRNRLSVVSDGVSAWSSSARRASTSTPRRPTSSCSTSTCPGWTAARCCRPSRPTPTCAPSRWSC